MPKGGPDGGDGGKGGDIIVIGDKNLHTLIDFRYKKNYKSQRGQHGLGANKTGKNGKDESIRVPIGTLIKDAVSGKILADIVEDKQVFIAAKGGRGGKGNARYVTSTNRAPREWEVGFPGQEVFLELELKLIADIGLVGLPNAGKSTLLSVISAARPKIADYPFTTLQPNLGIVKYSEYESFVVADIPGLIEGAHTGKGLGHQFLRHIERTRVLAYLVDISEEEPQKVYKTLKQELTKFSKSLVKKKSLVVLTKADLETDIQKKIKKFKDHKNIYIISSATGFNIPEIKQIFLKELKSSLESEPDE